MSSGYTPVFGSVFTGTLHGRWPDTGLWLCVLAMADKNGIVDVTPQYIASVTGLHVEQVSECMARFCEPDPYSRTPTDDGRRLVLIAPPRPWGWKVVNHAKYRERARLGQQNAEQVADGRNAEKVRRYKARKAQREQQETPEDTAGHPQTPPNTLSDADADTDSKNSPSRASATDYARGFEPEPASARGGGREFEPVPLEAIAGLSDADRDNLHAFVEVYPRSDHTSPKATVERFEFLVGMRRVASEHLVEKATEFAAYAVAKQWSPDMVPGAHNWLRDERWRQDYPIPAPRPAPNRKSTLEQDRERLEQWARDRGVLDDDAPVLRAAVD